MRDRRLQRIEAVVKRQQRVTTKRDDHRPVLDGEDRRLRHCWPRAYSDNMRPPVPEDPPTCDALPRGSVFWVSDPGRFVSHSGDGFSHGLPLQLDAVCVVE